MSRVGEFGELARVVAQVEMFMDTKTATTFAARTEKSRAP